MRWLNRLAAGLTGAISGMSIFLVLILAGAVANRWRGDVSQFGQDWGLVFGGYAAGLAWPLSALIAAAMLALLVIAGVGAKLRTPRRGSALLLGATALHAAWLFGIRPPASRPVVFLGKYVHGDWNQATDYFFPCEDPGRRLPRGADLTRPLIESDGLRISVPLPDSGWAGSHPRHWPSSVSNSHGTQYWLVRLRGTITGPGHYGRPPIMHYRMRVDSVLSVAPMYEWEDECGGPG